MAPNLTLQQQQAVAKAKARARASQAGVEPLGGASGEWDLSKFEALPKPAQTKPLANTINAPNPITTAVQQSQQKAGQDWVTNKAAADAARKERTLYNAASGMAFTGGEDGSMPQLNTDPGPLFSDLGKGVVTSPIRAERGVVSGVESILNFPSDVADFLNSANKPEYRSKPVPRVDFSGAKIPVPQELDSVSGMLGEGLAQFLVSRKMVGSMAPGGGLAPQLAKDAAATFVGFDGKTGRLADIIDSNAVPAGPMRDYLEFLKTQPDDSPLVGRFKNLLEDMTASSAMVAPLPVARAGLEAMKPKPGAVAAATPSPAPVRPAAPAAQPSPAPVTAIPQTPPRPAQGGPASPGQQPTAGPAPAAPGVTGGQGGGVLNAVPAAPVVSKGEVRVAKDTAKILSRIMRSSRINDADVRGYLPGAVQRYKGLNDPSVPFAFFLEGDLPQHFPQPIAEEVVTKLQTWGRERNAATGPQDTSRRTIQQTVKTLREGQQDYLSGVMDQNLYKGKLIGQEDKLKASLKANAQTAYDTALQNANNGLLSGRATVDQRNALGKIQELLHNDAFLKQVPQHLRIKAMREGIDLEDFVQKDPLAAAHWLQSELRQAVSAAEGVGGSATSESRLYGEMRQALLDQLETAVPGYKGARKAHGDIYGAVEALDFGNSFFKAARSEVETARLARQFKALSKRQQTAATMSIRDALKNEFRNKAEDTAAKVTRLQQAGVLEALETVLGADGKRVADGIRNIVKQNDRLKAIDQGSGSPTYSNQRGGEAAREMVQSPVNKAVGQFGDKTSWPVTIAGDIMLGTQGIPPLLTTSKVASAVVDRFGNPSPKMLSRATEGLYGLPAPPPANALSGPPTPRGGRPRVPAPPPTQQTLDDLLREYDAIDHRKEPGKAAQVLKKIDALKKRLAKDEANALSAPPSPPVKGPVNKAGFFGSGSKPLDMSEAGRMQRAREQGYTIEAYHGTRRDFDEFDVNEAGSNFSQDEGTIHFTDDAKDADRYAMSDTTGMPAEGGSTYPVLLRMKKPLVADRAFFEREGMGNVYANEDRISAWDTYHPFLKERAEEMGADGIILKDSFGKSHYVVFDPKNVRSKFATFDPSQSGSSKLLAGMGRGGSPRNPATVAQVTAQIKKEFGNSADAMMANGGVRIVNEPPKNWPTAVDPDTGQLRQAFATADADGNVTILASAINDLSDVRGTVMHEIGVHTDLQKIVGADGKAAIIKQIEERLAAGDEAVVAARKAVPEETHGPHVAEETLAYLVQNTPKHPIVQRIIASVKAWAYRHLKFLRGGMQLTDADLQALALGAVRNRIKSAKAGVNALKGGAKAAGRVPEQSGFFGKGPPKPANDAKPLKGNQKAWLGREMSDEDATSLMLAKQSGMKDAELAKAMKISVEDVPLAIERAREVATLINPKKVRTLRQQGVADEEIARQIGWSAEETDPASLRSALDALERKAIKAEPPAQAGFFSGGKGTPKTKGPKFSPKVVAEVGRLKNRLGPPTYEDGQPRNALAMLQENASKPQGSRVSAMEATGNAPIMFSAATRAQPPLKKNLLGKVPGDKTSFTPGLQNALASASARPAPNTGTAMLEFRGQQAEAATKAAAKAQRSENAAWKKGWRGDDIKPRVLTRIDAEKAKREAIAKMQDAQIPLEDAAIVRARVEARVSEIRRELNARPDLRDFSAKEREEMAKLLFSEEYSAVLADALSGKAPLRPRSQKELMLKIAAVGGLAAVGGSVAVVADVKTKEGRRMIAGPETFKNEPWDFPDPVEVKQIQRTLKELKRPNGEPYYSGAIEGDYGPQLTTAIMLFQNDLGLSHGSLTRKMLTKRTLDELRARYP